MARSVSIYEFLPWQIKIFKWNARLLHATKFNTKCPQLLRWLLLCLIFKLSHRNSFEVRLPVADIHLNELQGHDYMIKFQGYSPSNSCPWRRHQRETFSALLALCAGNSPVTGDFPAQRPVTRSFDVFVDLRLNKRLSKQWSGWWFETPSSPLWRHCNAWDKHDQWYTHFHWFNYCNRFLGHCTTLLLLHFCYSELFYVNLRVVVCYSSLCHVWFQITMCAIWDAIYIQHIGVETKWPPVCKGYLQMIFLYENGSIHIQISL